MSSGPKVPSPVLAVPQAAATIGEILWFQITSVRMNSDSFPEVARAIPLDYATQDRNCVMAVEQCNPL